MKDFVVREYTVEDLKNSNHEQLVEIGRHIIPAKAKLKQRRYQQLMQYLLTGNSSSMSVGTSIGSPIGASSPFSGSQTNSKAANSMSNNSMNGNRNKGRINRGRSGQNQQNQTLNQNQNLSQTQMNNQMNNQVLGDGNDDNKQDNNSETKPNVNMNVNVNDNGTDKDKENDDDEKKNNDNGNDKEKDKNGNDNDNNDNNEHDGSGPSARVMQTRKQAIEMWKKNKKVGQNSSDKRRWYCICDVDRHSANYQLNESSDIRAYWAKYDDEIQDILNERFSQFANNPNNLDLAAVEISLDVNGVKEKYKVVFDRAYLFAEQVLAIQYSKNHLRRNVILAEPDERGFIHQIWVGNPFSASPINRPVNENNFNRSGDSVPIVNNDNNNNNNNNSNSDDDDNDDDGNGEEATQDVD